MRLGIVILPSSELNLEIEQNAVTLKKAAALVFAVDNKKFFPHVTLFHLNAKGSKLKNIYGKLQETALGIKTFKAIVTNLETEDGYIGIGLKNDENLRRLHKLVVENISKFRDSNWHKLDGNSLQKRYVNKYGNKRVLSYYQPHVTLARVKNNKETEKVVKKAKYRTKSFFVNTLALTILDEQSQVNKILKVVYLDPISKAVEVLKNGGIVVYPTDTAYGLAVDATSVAAVKKLYRLKGRNFKNPIHIIPSSKYFYTSKYGSICTINISARKLIKKFWPGPLTIVLPLKSKSKSLSLLSAGTGTLGVRIPNNKLALELVKKFGKPITATSANVSGMPNCYSVTEVKKQFGKSKLKPDFYLDGGKLPKKVPSTVVSLIKGVKILRVGPITEKQIKKALNA